MSERRLAANQPDHFAFTPENEAWCETLLSRYPANRRASAVIPMLWRAQKQNDNWLSEPALRHVADRLGMNKMRVFEIVTFYTMFNLEPVGRFLVQLCGTVPCMLCGSDDLRDVCRCIIGAEKTVSSDGLWSWMEVECLGACVNAPVVQINDDYYEDLNAVRFQHILITLKEGGAVPAGTQIDRLNSAPRALDISVVDDNHAE